MKRRDVWLGFVLVMGFSLLSHAAPLSAQTFQPVFTKQYTRVAGTPVTTFDLFTACDPRGSFRVVVLNGPGGQGRISAGSIFLNGLEVIKEQDFNQQVAQIVRPLTNILQDNRLEVRLRSGPRAVIQVAVEGIQRCLGIKITSPAPGSVITRSPVLVQGEFNVPAGTEGGVTVNELSALAGNGRFAAFVAVDNGAQTLVARLNDLTGTIAEDSVTVQVVLPDSPGVLSLTPSPSSGVAPLQVDLNASFLGPAQAYQWDVDGNGTIDFVGPNLTDVTHGYQTPGLFFPKVTVTDTQGVRFTETAAVRVFSKDEVVALLQAKWQGLKDALRTGDVARALRFIAQRSRDAYREIFQNLTVPLSQIDQVLIDIQFVQLRENMAEFEMLRADERGTLSYLVRFVIDQDGIWRIRDM